MATFFVDIRTRLTSLLKEFMSLLIAMMDWLVHPLRWPATLWQWARVLWVCRIPAISALGGGLLLAATPQARDCFSDLGLLWWQWALFLVLVLMWAWIVHASARRALLADDWVPEAHCGALSAKRRQELRAAFALPAVWVPRLLGLAVPICVLGALAAARENLATAAGGLLEADEAIGRIAWLTWATWGVVAVYLIFVWAKRPIRKRIAGMADEPALLGGALPIPLSWWRRPASARAAPVLTGIDIGLSLIGVAITGFFVYGFMYPHEVADLLPRVLLVPLLFGGFVLALNEIAMWSTRLRTPFLLFVILVAGVFLYHAKHFHDVRFFEAKGAASPTRGTTAQIHFSEAVARWRHVNNDCGADAAEPAQKCPRPILIAGAGGASRAAFMTATVVGALIDLGRDEEATYGNLRNRIFAMSTVSGSSLGAVVMRAALTDAGESAQPDKPPCSQETGQRAWFRHRVNANLLAYNSYQQSWRDCFQLLLAGDFLSPVMLGLFYRDNFPLEFSNHPWWDDRAVLLEQAFERQYDQVTGDGRSACGETANRGLCRPFGYHPPPGDKNVWLPLLFINGTSVWTGRRIIASDIPMGDCDVIGTDKMPLFPSAYDVREYLSPNSIPLAHCREPENDKAAKQALERNGTGQNRDIRLSTAATVSARFPVISPQGNFRDALDNRADEVVDGGYFENDGLATIGDVAEALRRYHLDPVIIRIVNEPIETGEAKYADTDRPPPPVSVEQQTWFDDVVSVVHTLVSTRNGHLDADEAYAKYVSDNRLIRIGVYEQLEATDASSGDNPLCRWHPATTKNAPIEMKNVSMSWWMSHPVQAYIDAQLCKRENWQALRCAVRLETAGEDKTCPADLVATH